MVKDLTIFTDGGARGNPGPAASAFVVVVGEKVTHSGSLYLGVNTNNQAEYKALILALEWLLGNHREGQIIHFNLDSQLVVNQITGRYKINNADLKELYNKAKNLEKQITAKIVFHLIPREKNKLADLQVNETLDSQI